MEEIYNPDVYGASKKLDIKEFLSTYKRALDRFRILDHYDEASDEFTKAFQMMGIDFCEEKKEYLINACSIKNLEFEGDVEPMDTTNYSLQKLVINFRKIEGSPDLATIKRKSKEHERIRQPISLEIPPKMSENSVMDLMAGQEAVITISVFSPFKYQFAQTAQRGKLKLFKEITVLGRNTLSQFKDLIKCPSDNIICKEVSQKPDFELNYPSSTDIYPSSFIFIDGVFYNDFRQEKAIDYSEVIRNWALKKNIAIFKTAEMSTVTFLDLCPRIGYPYVYQHKACCEHIIVFSQVRVLNWNDCLSSRCYPYHSKSPRVKDRLCLICGTNFSVWVIEDSDRLPQNNAPMCTTCFKSYNYIDGKKVGEFKAYPITSLLDVT